MVYQPDSIPDLQPLEVPPIGEPLSPQLQRLVERVNDELMMEVTIRSIDPHEPVVVDRIPSGWQLLGAGNYAAVFCHRDHPHQVVKIYASDRPGFEEEQEVYRRLGSHPSFSECLYSQPNVLVLKRLEGVTLYDCVHRGLAIPTQVIRDIDRALDYARHQGLHPHDVHGRNVMMQNGRGLVVDVSDFLHNGSCSKWNHLKQAYYWFYRPILRPLRLAIPYSVLNFVRRTYRKCRRVFRLLKRKSI